MLAQVFDPDGSKSGGQLIVHNGNQNIQSILAPAVTALADGRFMVAWRDPDSTINEIDARILNSDGTASGSEFVITNNAEFHQPAVVSLDDGGFFVTWTSGGDVHGRTFAADGAPTGAEFVVNTTTANAQFDSMLAHLADGNFITTWVDQSQFALTGHVDIRAQILHATEVAINRVGTDASEVLFGSSLDDYIDGRGGNDQIYGRPGNDTLIGGTGRNYIDGGSGNDTLTVGERTYGWGLNGAQDKIGDFDGDGKADITQLVSNGHANVWLSNGSALNGPTNWGANVTAADQIGDFNGDGRSDLIQLGNGNAYVSLSNGSNFGDGYGVWSSSVNLGSGAVGKVADFNGDNKDDLITLVFNGNATVWLSNGTGFDSPTVWGAGVTAADQTGDFNGDGKADLIQLLNGNAYVWLSNGSDFGDPSLPAGYSVWTQGGTTTQDQIGDFNGDGKDELIQFASGNAYVWLSNGSSFDAYTQWGSGFSSNQKIGDFNGDGKLDIIEIPFNGNATVWLSNGNSFDAPTVWGAGVTPQDQVADFNGDGKDDLIQPYGNGNAYVWISNGSGFGDPSLLPGGYTIWGTGIADQNTFNFAPGFGKDTITDFNPASDVLQFNRALFPSPESVMNNTADDGLGNTVIVADINDTVTLLGVLKADLSLSDFLIV
jgi:hypothetical protein